MTYDTEGAPNEYALLYYDELRVEVHTNNSTYSLLAMVHSILSQGLHP